MEIKCTARERFGGHYKLMALNGEISRTYEISNFNSDGELEIIMDDFEKKCVSLHNPEYIIEKIP